ncbi:transposase [Nocardia sp. 2YAB30]|uniref:transposase n=1 Tax=unclassified Nocardia TaxID=2637762 RepID=UPI003F95AFDE
MNTDELAFELARAERRVLEIQTKLHRWAGDDPREAGLPELEPFLRGLDQDHDAAVAGLTLPYSNGPCEGVNTKTKLLERQMYGRAGFRLLRHRILLG